MKRFLLLASLSAVFIVQWSCSKDDQDPGDAVIELSIPTGFPSPTIPSDNQPTQHRIDLGKMLFFDPILSRDSTVACGSCHFPEHKMTDARSLSVGIDSQTTFRNAMTILNVAYQPYLFWDGGVPTLEQQVLAPISNPHEMDYDANLVVERLKKHPVYPQMFRDAYDQEPTIYSLTRAIACYERTLFTGKSRYDRFLYYKDSSALSSSEQNGMKIFFGEQGECFHCHGEYNFTDYSFRNNGLYEFYQDSGRARITLEPSDAGKFKVPSLRNVDLTAPYMHDGSLATLEEVVDHYNSGGKNNPNKSGLIKPLGLSDSEKQDLINFLKSLTDE
jgi:cytochrome c peroxidase